MYRKRLLEFEEDRVYGQILIWVNVIIIYCSQQWLFIANLILKRRNEYEGLLIKIILEA